MAGDVNPSLPNTCCVQWTRRCEKLEKSRDALRQSVKILEGQIERQSMEIASLKKEVEKQRRQSEQQKNDRNKIANINKELEKQIQDMKVNISSMESTRSLKSIDEDEIGMLKSRILVGQEEIKSLKELLEKERKKSFSERRMTEFEKKRATEALKTLEDEKRKGEEHKFLLVSTKKKAEDLRISFEKFKAESNEEKEKLNAEIAKAYDEKRQIEFDMLKAHGEQKHAKSERTKVEEQKKLMEDERKVSLSVNERAIHLRQKLEKEKRKREELQKKLEDVSAISFFGDKEQSSFKNLKAAELKLLKDRLKLERKRVKHAEKVAKQEKSKKKVVMQEVHLLKQNLIQILYRLNMLDSLMGSTDMVQKTLNYPDLTCFKLNDLLLSKKDDYDRQTVFGPSEIRYVGPLIHAEPIGECIGLPLSKGCCSRPKTGISSGLESPVGGSLRHKSQSSAVCSTSICFSDSKLMGSQGIDSVVENSTDKFEPKHTLTVSGFPGAASQNAVHVSCQVRKDFGGTDLKGVEKPRSKSKYKDTAQMRKNSSKKRKFDILVKADACLHSGDGKPHSVIGDKLPALNDQLKNLKQFSLPNCSDGSADFNNADYEKSSLKEGCSNHCRSNFNNANMVSTDHRNEKSIAKCTNKKKGDKHMSKNNIDPCLTPESGSDFSQFVFDQASTSPENEQASLKNFENICRNGGCLKLLDLDDYSDEVRYINAMKAPLSPTLPEIELPNFHIDGTNDSQALMVNDIPVPGLSNSSVIQRDILHDITGDTSLADNNRPTIAFECNHGRRPENELGCFPLMKTRTGQHGHCVQHFPAELSKIELEVFPTSGDSNNTFSRGHEKSQPSSDAIGESSWHSHSHPFNNGEHSVSSTLGNLSSSNHSSLSGIKLHKAHGGCQPMSSDFTRNHTELETLNSPIFDRRLNLLLHDADKLTKGNSHFSAEKDMEHNSQQLLETISKVHPPVFSSQGNLISKGNDEADPEKLSYLILFSSSRNMDCIFRVIFALNAFTYESLKVSETDLLLVEVLSGLLFEDLQSEEKVEVFFSFLLGSLSARMSEHCKHIVDRDSLQFVESFYMEISRVVSVGKVKCFLDQMFHLDILFRLMEAFLIEREVLVIGDVKQHSSSFPVFSGNKFHLDVANNCVFSKDVTVSQFIAGCTILASICVAADDIGFLLAISYKMLRTCQDDISSVLLALHIFSKICGECFLNMDNYSLLVASISSLVTLFEGRKRSVSELLSHNPNLEPGLVADFSPCKECPFATDALCMDKLIRFLLDVLEAYSLPSHDYPNTSNCFITSNGSVPIRDNREKVSSDGQSKFDIQCNTYCTISRYVKLAVNQSASSSDTVFCDFTDIISLVELVDQYMGQKICILAFFLHQVAVAFQSIRKAGIGCAKRQFPVC